LAQLKAGINMDTGPTSQQLADIGTLDPGFADKEYERAMTERAAAKLETQREGFETTKQSAQFTHEDDTREDTQKATAEQNDLNRQADDARQRLADANADGRQDDAQQA